MPAKDIYHDTVKRALEKDGWKITKENLPLRWGRKYTCVDIAAEKLFSAEKEGRKIAVEVKSFVGKSDMVELEKALGQFRLYRLALRKKEQDRELFLAIPKEVYNELFLSPDGFELIESEDLRLITFDIEKEAVVQWIN
jgi:Holliday junction resolvase-like predicted endonuclease